MPCGCCSLFRWLSLLCFIVPFLFAASALGCIDERWNGWMPTQKNLVDEWLAMNERLKQAYPAAVWYLWFLFFVQDAFWDVAYTTVDLALLKKTLMAWSRSSKQDARCYSYFGRSILPRKWWVAKMTKTAVWAKMVV